MLKKHPAIKHLKLNINGNPPMLENTTEMITNFGIPLDGVTPVFNLMIMWEFRAYDTMNKNTRLIDSQVWHEHQFKKFVPVSVDEVREMINNSNKESNDIFEKELKKNGVNYRATALSEDMLIKYSVGLHSSIQKYLQ